MIDGEEKDEVINLES